MNTTNFDLTAPEGRQRALETFDKYGWTVASPIWFVRLAYKAITKNTVATVEAQKQAAIDIIKAGKENRVASMTIKMDRTAGVDLGGAIEGIPIKLKMGDSGTVEISVQYNI